MLRLPVARGPVRPRRAHTPRVACPMDQQWPPYAARPASSEQLGHKHMFERCTRAQVEALLRAQRDVGGAAGHRVRMVELHGRRGHRANRRHVHAQPQKARGAGRDVEHRLLVRRCPGPAPAQQQPAVARRPDRLTRVTMALPRACWGLSRSVLRSGAEGTQPGPTTHQGDARLTQAQLWRPCPHTGQRRS